MVSLTEFVGQKIKQHRKWLGISQFELAEKVGVHEKQIYRIETGLNSPSITTLLKIVHALNMDIRVLDYENADNFNPVKDEIYSLLAKSSNEELVLVRNLILTIRDSQRLTTKENKEIEKATADKQKEITN